MFCRSASPGKSVAWVGSKFSEPIMSCMGPISKIFTASSFLEVSSALCRRWASDVAELRNCNVRQIHSRVDPLLVFVDVAFSVLVFNQRRSGFAASVVPHCLSTVVREWLIMVIRLPRQYPL